MLYWRFPVVSRRSVLKSAAGVLGAPFFNSGRFRLFAGSSIEYSTMAVDLVEASNVIDMLGLLTLDFRRLWAWQNRPEDLQPQQLAKWKSSGITVFHPATGYTEGDVYSASLRDIAGWNRLIECRPQDFMRIGTTADLAQVKTSGKIGILIGQQNSQHFRSVEDVDRFYAMGQRVSQLTYFHNRLGGGSLEPQEGLSDYGSQIVARMNQLGMAVDVSHCADRTTLDAVEASSKPVLITHSNCRTLVPGSPRCKTDEAIRKVASKGGVMGVTMIRFFVHNGGSVTIVQISGVEHAGIGSDVDLDGRDRLPGAHLHSDLDGIDYRRKIFDIAEGLVRRGYTREHIRLILGGNFQRALSEIWT